MRQLRPLIVGAAAVVAALALAGCRHDEPGYPRDWPSLAWTWGCPDLTGQWRVGGEPGVDLGPFKDSQLMLVMGKTHVPWEVMSISYDANRRMQIRLARSTIAHPDPLSKLPDSLHRFTDVKRPDSYIRLTAEAAATHDDRHLDRDLYQCSGNKVAVDHWFDAREPVAFYLAKDKHGDLVGVRVGRTAVTVQFTADSANHTLGYENQAQWTHWRAITPAEFAAVAEAGRVDSTVFDLGALPPLGPVGPQDVKSARANVTPQLRGSTRMSAIAPAGDGAVIVTLHTESLTSLQDTLGRLADGAFDLSLRRFDPTHGDDLVADVLLRRRAASAMPWTPGTLTLADAQAAVASALPDSMTLRSVVFTGSRFRVYAAGGDVQALAWLMRKLKQDGRFDVHPESPEQVTRGSDGSVGLELTQRGQP